MDKKNKQQIIQPPSTGTIVLTDYFWSQSCDFKLFNFVIDTVLTGDYAAHIAYHALAGSQEYKLTNPKNLAKSNPGSRTVALRKSRQELLEMFLTRIIDNFQIYIVEVIREVLKFKPEILSSRKQELTIGEILKYKSIGDLVANMVEGKINSLSYEGFGDIQEWCKSKGIPLIVPANDLKEVVKLISIRNIIIHNRGIVDSRFLNAIKSSEIIEGQKIELETEYVFNSCSILNNIVSLTDKAIIDKFKLNTINPIEEIDNRSKNKF